MGEKTASSQEKTREILAMYDVRGIQKYIYRTAKVRDAIGASSIVENIINKALENAVKEYLKLEQESGEKNHLKSDLKWFDDNGVRPYEEYEGEFVQVLYIGGGNAYVRYSSKELALKISKRMSRYIIDHTYSLQLATAFVEKSDNYSKDYRNLNEQMIKVKEKMCDSKPLGALPIMDIEIKTGFPLSEKIDYEDKKEKVSRETKLKAGENRKVRSNQEREEKIFDSYVTKKGTDSTLAVVHIDGNNMGLRIRGMIKDETEYSGAVNKMRQISFQINDSYKKVFNDMKSFFEGDAYMKDDGKDNHYFVMKVLTAGDDITYICNATIALATVEYFCNEISKYSMNTDEPDNPEYKFSVCAGVAYIGSHFPFSVGYEVAEECCSSAKKIAKENKDGEKVGNWVDFQICKNVKALDFDNMRKNEYITCSGEQLLRRPYYIYAKEESNVFKELNKKENSFEQFKKDFGKFTKTDENSHKREIPRSFLKEIRNTYPLGKNQINILNSFLKSRNNHIADDDGMYFTNEKGETAMYYDNLEMMDYYIDLEDIRKKKSEKNNHLEMTDGEES